MVRTAVASEPTLLRHYDLNQNGTLDDDEWRVAKLSIGGALAGNVGLNPARGEEQRRLDAVADEVARRRALREKTGETFETAKANPAAETKRLETVADEIEERRKQREKIGSGQLPPQTQLERTEQEAKLLVKELLEIGMAQRRAYEEARARAADEQKKKAEAEAKK